MGSKRSKDEHGAQRPPLAPPPTRRAVVEAGSVRANLEGYVAALIHDLDDARAALRDGMTGHNGERISEAGHRLERLGEALRLAPDGLEQHLRARLGPLASTRPAPAPP